MKKLESKRKLNNGITLIALVITIIVLLILAGVAIVTLTGENGLIARAKEAAEKAKIEEYREAIQLSKMAVDMERATNPMDTKTYLTKVGERIKLDNALKEAEIELDLESNPMRLIVTTKDKYKYEVTEEWVKLLEKPSGETQPEEETPPDLQKGDVTFTYTPNTWTNGAVEVEIKVEKEGIEGYTVQYSLDATNWENYTQQIKVKNNKQEIYVRLINVEKYGGYYVGNVENIDRLVPNTFTATATVEENTITLTGTTTDKAATEIDGSSGIKLYYFSKDNGETWEPTNGQGTGSYTFKDLEYEKKYSLQIRAVDQAGNQTTSTVEATTQARYQKELSYLVTTGNQYIHTGFIPNQDTSVEIKFQLLTKKDQFIFGSRHDTKSNTYCLLYNNAESGDSEQHGIRTDYCNEQGTVAQEPDGVHTMMSDKNNFYIDGNLVYSHLYANFSTANNDMILFNVNTNGTINSSVCSELKFYYCKVWDGSNLVRDFIPVVDNKGKVCIYDRVEDKLYYPEYGDVQEEFLSDTDFIELESIDATGTQNIDTGIKPNQNTTVEMKFKVPTSIVTRGFLFGSRTSSSEKQFAQGYYSDTGVMRFDYGTTHSSFESYPAGQIYIVKQAANQFYVNNQLVGSSAATTFSGDYNLHLFAVNTSETISTNIAARCYYCKIWDGSTLVRDFIPTIGPNNKFCLYDKVGGNYYYSGGADLKAGAPY